MTRYEKEMQSDDRNALHIREHITVKIDCLGLTTIKPAIKKLITKMKTKHKV